ncbi:MAG: hypothetical protein ACHREM_13420 [Polyangiales bacterium]
MPSKGSILKCPVRGLDAATGEHRVPQKLAGIACPRCGPKIEVASRVCTVDGERVAVRCAQGGHDYVSHRAKRP